MLPPYAIAPSAPALDWSGFVPMGDVENVTPTDYGYLLTCRDEAAVELHVLAPDLVRLRARFAGQPSAPDRSCAIAKRLWAAVPCHATVDTEVLTFATPELEVLVRRSPFLITFRDPRTGRIINADERPISRDPATGRLASAKKLGFDEHFYGLGEKAARLDRRRGYFRMWNTDTPAYVEGSDPLYQSIPFYVGLEAGKAYGLFYDNSYRSAFDLGHTGQDYACYTAEGGLLDLYFFYGPSLKKVLGRYTELTGRMPLPPLWALGNQQSRYTYYPEGVVEAIVAEYRKRDLPLDVVYLDIHFMDGFRVFTWDKKRFPDPSALVQRLKRQGIKLITIVDPGVKYDPAPVSTETDTSTAPSRGGYSVYEEGLANDHFLRNRDGSLYIGEVWPGKSVFVDYTKPEAREWWGKLHRSLLDTGVAGIWNDMNEPADFRDQSGGLHKDIVFNDDGQHAPYAKHRNTFALNMARATQEGLLAARPDERPFIVTRAGYAGIQRYATMWTGDNNATFEALALNVPMFASLGLSGETFVGADLPGFVGRGSGELLARAYQIGFLAPLCRNHGMVDDYDHEPWRYGTAYEDIVRKYLKLRYRLLPFLYTTLEEAHRTGVPLFRPLLLNFQDDPNTLNLDDEFMVGDVLLAAPVIAASARTRDVYLPKGLWYDFWTGSIRNQGMHFDVAAPLDHLPLFVRGGSILPSTRDMAHTGDHPWNPLRFDVYPDERQEASGSLYEDDGRSNAYQKEIFRRILVSYYATESHAGFNFTVQHNTHAVALRTIEVIVHRPRLTARVLLDDSPLLTVAADSSTPGFWYDTSGSLHFRFQDDGSNHVIALL